MYWYDPRTGQYYVQTHYNQPNIHHLYNTFFQGPYVPYTQPISPVTRQFPQVDPSKFMNSAKYMQSLMRDASTLLDKMADSKDFAFKLMSLAQESKQKQIEKQIQETGIKNIPKVDYTPDGLRLKFETDSEHENCCTLTLAVRWM